MEVHRWILRRILARIPTHPASCAYGHGQSIRQCAARHAGARWLVKLDIANFFESISEARVHKVFTAAGYQPLPAFELARLCTRSAAHAEHVDERSFASRRAYATISDYDQPCMGFLPQGAPTSGAIANLVAQRLDSRLAGLAHSRDFVYTRYADDMTFSSTAEFDRGAAVRFARIASQIVRREGFKVQEAKTRIAPPGSRKIVLGLLVDGDVPRLNAALRRRLANHVRGVEKFGLAEHTKHMGFASIEGLVRHVGGLIAHASDIEPHWANELAEHWREALTRDHWG
jgi:RNA-directed DNA polymerase